MTTPFEYAVIALLAMFCITNLKPNNRVFGIGLVTTTVLVVVALVNLILENFC